MSRSAVILDHLREELGFAPHLLGGAKTVLAQIDRFLAENPFPPGGDLRREPALWNRLIAEVIVPETSFFRYPESFLALQQWAAGRKSPSIRALCLPCSTGEEAWSIAITLREAGRANFRVEAADASARSVAHAARGEYSVRAARGLSDDRRKRWFQADDHSLSIAAELRPFVDFRAANAFSFHADPQSYDVIFCRNLLIYFDVENQQRLFARLAAWLRADGVLFLGPGEATVAASHGWKGTGLAMSFSFVRREAPPAAPKKSPSLQPRKSPAPAGPIVPKSLASRPLSAKEPATDIDWLRRAKELADLGQLKVASEAIEKFHSRHAPSAESLLLRGIIAEAGGNRAEAEADYRRTLYLAPDHLDALHHLSLLLESEGRFPAALPFRRRIDRLTALP